MTSARRARLGPDARRERGDAELVAHGIGLAARGVLGADDECPRKPSSPMRREREGDLVAQRAGHDGDRPFGGALAHDVGRALEDDEPRFGAAHVKGALSLGERFDLGVGGGATSVDQHGPNGADVVESEVALDVRAHR